MHTLPTYWRNIRLLRDGEAAYSHKVRLAFLPTLRSSKRIRRSVKYKSGNIEHPSAVWIWDYKARVVRNHAYNIESDLLNAKAPRPGTMQTKFTPLALFGHSSGLLDTAEIPARGAATVRNYSAPISRWQKVYDREYRQNNYPKQTIPQGRRKARLAREAANKGVNE